MEPEKKMEHLKSLHYFLRRQKATTGPRGRPSLTKRDSLVHHVVLDQHNQQRRGSSCGRKSSVLQHLEGESGLAKAQARDDVVTKSLKVGSLAKLQHCLHTAQQLWKSG